MAAHIASSVESDLSDNLPTGDAALGSNFALDEAYFKSIMTDKGVFVDLKGVYKNKFADLDYWSL